jgi:acetyltransferase-like isoleucine patch superfamily enzyme
MATPGLPLPDDWYPGRVPLNADIDPAAHVETTFSFLLYRSELTCGVRIGRGASTYIGTMFDVGRDGFVSIGDNTLVNGARIIADRSVVIGSHGLISWNVVIMDTYRFSTDPLRRHQELLKGPQGPPYVITGAAPAKPVSIGNNVWVGFDVVVLPGVTVGDGAVIGARSVVDSDVDPFTVVAGNPARPVRKLREWHPEEVA